MNWKLLAPLLITTVVAIFGWFAAHRLAASRERAAKRREVRVSYLIETYRNLAHVCHRPLRESEDSRLLESLISDIQLFGTQGQIDLAHTFVKEFSSTKKGDADAILADINHELRKELGLQPSSKAPVHLRLTS